MTPGDRGGHVAALQRDLAELGYEPGAIDGDYGARTTAAVLAFQLEYSDVDDDGLAGPQTLARIAQALAAKRSIGVARESAITPVRCNDATWSAFEQLVALVVKNVRYGPGRGLWSNGRFVVTHGPGAIGAKAWKSFASATYPSFHCSSWTNFAIGWLLRRNELYTHAGNVPDLFDLLERAPALHTQAGASPYRGYGDACVRLAGDGSGAARLGIPNVVDARELLARREALPSFVVCGQSTRTAGRWKWWHHTVLFAVRDGRLFRIAADGYRDPARGYSAQPMRWFEVNEKNVAAFDGLAYRPYAVTPNADGSYGDTRKPIAAVELER